MKKCVLARYRAAQTQHRLYDRRELEVDFSSIMDELDPSDLRRSRGSRSRSERGQEGPFRTESQIMTDLLAHDGKDQKKKEELLAELDAFNLKRSRSQGSHSRNEWIQGCSNPSADGGPYVIVHHVMKDRDVAAQGTPEQKEKNIEMPMEKPLVIQRQNESLVVCRSPLAKGRPRQPVSVNEIVADDKGAEAPDEEKETLMEELTIINRQNEYYDFVERIARDLEPADEEDAEDVEYATADEEHEQMSKGSDGVSSSVSSLSDAEDEEEELDERDACAVPPGALLEAHKRFPPFWRTKHGLRNVDSQRDDDEAVADADYVPEESVDEDVGAVQLLDPTGAYGPKYVKPPTPTRDGPAQATPASDSSESEEEEGSLPPDELGALEAERVDELTRELDSVTKSIQELTLPPEVEMAPAEESCGESMEESEPASLFKAIDEFDLEGYRSGEDPDFVPSAQEMEAAEHSPSEGSSSEDEGDAGDGEAMDE